MKTRFFSARASVLALTALTALGCIGYLGFNGLRSNIDASIAGGEVCDNKIDDNGDGRIDDCWDPGGNYQPTSKIYYVSKATNANDSNPGTESSPFRSINKATSLVQPGGAVYVLPGVYQEDVEFGNAGTSSNPILLKGIGSRESIIIRKSSDWTSTGFVGITPKSNTIIQNLSTDGVSSVTNSGHGFGGYGIYLNNVDNILVENCYLRMHEKAIRAEAGNRLIVRNSLMKDNEYGATIGVSSNGGGPTLEFNNTLWDNVEAADTIYSEWNTDGFASEGSNAYHVFRNCKAHGWGDGGFDLKSHVLIDNCVSYDNSSGQGSGEGYKVWRDATIRNSIAYDNEYANYLFGGLSANWKMIGNVSYNGKVSFEKRSTSDPNLSARTITVSHNLFVNTKFNDEIGNNTGVSAFAYSDHNLFFGGDTPSSTGTSSKTSDPKFKSASARDFHLMEGSPAIDAGVANPQPFMALVDFAGNSRKAGSAVDIGPYEYGSSPASVTQSSVPYLSPTLSQTLTVIPYQSPIASRTVTPVATPTPRPSVEVYASPIKTTTATPSPLPSVEVYVSPIASVTSTPPSGANQPPAISEILPKIVKSGSALKFNIYATDPEGKSVSYRITLPNGSTTSTNVFYWKPSRNQFGSYTAKVRATDTLGAYSEKIIDIKVLRSVSFFETRWLNVKNTPDKPDVYFQVCRRSTYSSTRYMEVITFSDGSDYLTIKEPGRSACTNYYSHHYNPGTYTMTLYLCSRDSSGNPVSCFPNVAQVIKR